MEILEDKVRNYFEKNRKLKSDIENSEINEGNNFSIQIHVTTNKPFYTQAFKGVSSRLRVR